MNTPAAPEIPNQDRRPESELEGVEVDPYLAGAPDGPVYGLNLACAYPFPAVLETAYNGLVERLARLGPAVYVYPFWQTHITIVTFLNFRRYERPDVQQRRELGAWAGRLRGLLSPLFAAGSGPVLRPFDLDFGAPVLTRRAGILPISNPTGELNTLRQRVTKVLRSEAGVYLALQELGLNIPSIIHATILRFVQPPSDLATFLAAFAAAATRTPLGRARIEEVLLTAETKPYMRGGEVLHRFRLGRALNAARAGKSSNAPRTG